MPRFATRYTHQIAHAKDPAADDGPEVTLTAADLADKKKLGAALRKQGVILTGARVESFRVENDGDKIVIFPKMPGLTTYHHAITFTKRADTQPAAGAGDKVVKRKGEAGFTDTEAMAGIAGVAGGYVAAGPLNARIKARPLGPRVPPSAAASVLAFLGAGAVRKYRPAMRKTTAALAGGSLGLAAGTVAGANQEGGILAPKK